MFYLKRQYAIALWHYHFFGYEDYRDDLRKALEILEELYHQTIWDPRFAADAKAEAVQNLSIVLFKVRNQQLDWCIHDLTPATFQAYRHL